MKNAILLTSKIVDSEQLEELRRRLFHVKVIHVFGAALDPAHLEMINRFTWLEQVIVDDDLYDVVESVIRKPKERLSNYVYVNPPLGDTPQTAGAVPGDVLFVPCNDTHVKMMLPMAEGIPNHHFLVIRGENAERYLSEHHEPFTTLPMNIAHSPQYRSEMLALFRRYGTSAVVFGNDWVGENWRICHVARHCGIPTICIQEGPQDFELEGGWQRQMQYADYVFLQGLSTIPYLDATHFFVSGNPRLSACHPLPLPEPPAVLINSNFTYGVCEEARDRWVADCVDACARLSVDYFISQHPRDTGDLGKYKVIRSDAFKLPEQLARCNVVITRFSQVLHEAMLSGRQVIYYNPHGEVKRVHTEDRSGGFFHAHDPESLAGALAVALRPDFPNEAERTLCNRFHCGPCDGREVERCIEGIVQVAWQHRHALESFGASGAWRQARAPRPESVLGHLAANWLRRVFPEEVVQRIRRAVRGGRTT